MKFVAIEKAVFSKVVVFTIFLSLFRVFIDTRNTPPFSELSEGRKTDRPKSIRWQGIIECLNAFVVCALIMFALIYFIHGSNIMAVILICLSAPIVLNQVLGTLLSMGTIARIVGSNETGSLTSQELTAIEMTATAIWFLGLYDCFFKAIYYFSCIQNLLLSDFLVVLTYTSTQFLYIFFSCALLSGIISFLFSMIPAAKKHTLKIDMLREKGITLSKDFDSTMIQPSSIVSWIEHLQAKKRVNQYLGYVALPLLFLIDIMMVFIHLIKSVICAVVGYLLLILYIFCILIKRLIKYIIRLSSKRITAISFRIALIMSLTLTVIINRFQPILKQQEAGTAVLEFVASAIIIPVIFDWIHSVHSSS